MFTAVGVLDIDSTWMTINLSFKIENIYEKKGGNAVSDILESDENGK